MTAPRVPPPPLLVPSSRGRTADSADATARARNVAPEHVATGQDTAFRFAARSSRETVERSRAHDAEPYGHPPVAPFVPAPAPARSRLQPHHYLAGGCVVLLAAVIVGTFSTRSEDNNRHSAPAAVSTTTSARAPHVGGATPSASPANEDGWERAASERLVDTPPPEPVDPAPSSDPSTNRTDERQAATIDVPWRGFPRPMTKRATIKGGYVSRTGDAPSAPAVPSSTSPTTAPPATDEALKVLKAAEGETRNTL